MTELTGGSDVGASLTPPSRSMQLGLLVEHAQWALDTDGDPSFVAIARRLARTPIDPVIAEPTADIDAILAAAEGGPRDEQP